MQSFVVGATGIVGGYIVKHLVRSGETPLALSRAQHRSDGVVWLQGDLATPETLKPPSFETLYCTAEIGLLAEALPQFRYVPALSEPADGDGWDGETGLITDVVRRHEAGLARAHAYVCGPPPMVEAAIPLLEQLGVPEKRIYYDKFTTTGDPEEG